MKYWLGMAIPSFLVSLESCQKSKTKKVISKDNIKDNIKLKIKSPSLPEPPL
jgi:hypothetical protein